VRVFYPSSVYVCAADRPQGLAEYGIAKAAGEALCAEINRACPKIEVLSRRLPRVQTDQTASFVSEQSYARIDEVMLTAIREMHGEVGRR
jgi:hypothetical protein